MGYGSQGTDMESVGRFSDSLTFKNGARYSDILAETGLTTSRLNYQLRKLSGFISKEKQLYRLSSLGCKAIGVLNYMGEDIDQIDLGPSVEGERSRYVKGVIDKLFFIFALIIVGDHINRCRPRATIRQSIHWAANRGIPWSSNGNVESNHNKHSVNKKICTEKQGV